MTMFTINLEEELVSSKRASLTQDERNTLAEAKKILSNSTEEDIRILTNMGLDYSLDSSKKLETKIRFINAFDKTRVFSKDEIKDLCITYGLRFLEIDKFKGEIDPALPGKVKEFEKIYNEIKNNSYDFQYRNFMICAPKESFRLSERPVDPLLFYPIKGGDYFLVHKWGNDISVWNAIKAWRNQHFGTWFLYLYLLYALPLTVIATWVFDINVDAIGILFVSALASLGWSAAAGMAEFFDGKFSIFNWNSEFKD